MRKILIGFGVFFNLISLTSAAQSRVLLKLGTTVVQAGIPAITDSAGKTFSFRHEINIRKINEQLFHVRIGIHPEIECRPGSIDFALTLNFNNTEEVNQAKNNFHWVPTIKSSPEQVIAQHVFRAPCIILTLKKNAMVFIPDIEAIKNNTVAPYYMDLQYHQKSIVIHYGLSNYNVVSHQYYQKNNKPFFLKSGFEMAFYVLLTTGTSPLATLKATNSFLWDHYAKEYTGTYLPQVLPFEKYASTGYEMAMEHYWVNTGKDKGGISLSTFYDSLTKTFRGRDSKDDLWYQSWFNNIRTAYGLYAWGKRLNRAAWQQKALSCINQLSGVPKEKGWFPTIYNSQSGQWIASGQGGGPEVYHLPDNIWTAYWLMRFNDELVQVKGSQEMIKGLASALLSVQNSDGSFPTRIHTGTLLADTVLNGTASSAMATWYLEELLLRNKVSPLESINIKKAVQHSLLFLDTKVLPQQRFEDFESYFSCSAKPMHYFDTSTYMFSQNTLSIQWCAEAYLKAYSLFRDIRYLRQGEYCLNILSLYQQVWNPPFIHYYAFGGFGAQNSDAEWSDARQAQFSETYLDYYLVTKNREYLERAVYACRASFALMVIPENKNICPDNYLGTAINGESFPGNMAENYGHSGYDERSYQSGFHWGSGSALTTAAILKNKLGDLYITGQLAIGVDGIVIKGLQRTASKIIITTRRLEGGVMNIGTDQRSKKTIFADNKIVVPFVK